MRKHHIAQLQADIACNDVLHPRLKQIAADVEAKGPEEFSTLVERFKTNPSPEKPPTNSPQQQTYDEMLLALLLKVWEDVKKEGVEKDDPKLGEALAKGVQQHVVSLGEHQQKLKDELEKEEAEQKKKITSDDIHEGWESHVSFINFRVTDRVDSLGRAWLCIDANETAGRTTQPLEPISLSNGINVLQEIC